MPFWSVKWSFWSDKRPFSAKSKGKKVNFGNCELLNGHFEKIQGHFRIILLSIRFLRQKICFWPIRVRYSSDHQPIRAHLMVIITPTHNYPPCIEIMCTVWVFILSCTQNHIYHSYMSHKMIWPYNQKMTSLLMWWRHHYVRGQTWLVG